MVEAFYSISIVIDSCFFVSIPGRSLHFAVPNRGLYWAAEAAKVLPAGKVVDQISALCRRPGVPSKNSFLQHAPPRNGQVFGAWGQEGTEKAQPKREASLSSGRKKV